MRREVLVMETISVSRDGVPLHDGFLTFAARLVQIFIPLVLFVLLGMGSDGFQHWDPERGAGCLVVGLGISALLASRLRLVPRIYAGESGLDFHWIWQKPRHFAWAEIREVEPVTAIGRQIQPRFRLHFIDPEQEPIEFFADPAFRERVEASRCAAEVKKHSVADRF
jgi:hypothetical protein